MFHDFVDLNLTHTIIQSRINMSFRYDFVLLFLLMISKNVNSEKCFRRDAQNDGAAG